MGRKSKPLEVEIFLSLDGKDGHYKPWDECTPEEKERFRKGTREKVSRCLSDYYCAHPEELERLLASESSGGKTTDAV